MEAAFALLPLGLIACVFVWQSGRTERQRMAIGWQRERLITEQQAAQKRWEDEKAETLAGISDMRSELDTLRTDLTRYINERVVIPRKAG